MNYNIDPQIASALLTVGLTCVAAVIGYFFREYRNRVKPFITVSKVEGELRDASKPIELPQDIVDLTQKLLDITQIQFNKKTNTTEIQRFCNEIKKLIDNVPEFLSFIDEFKEFIEKNEFKGAQNLLLKIIQNNIYDYWIMLLITVRSIRIPKPKDGLNEVIELSEEPSMYNGCFSIKFPGKVVTFGSNLKEQNMAKAQCKLFTDLIKYLDFDAIFEVFKQIKEFLKNSLDISKDLEPKLKKILDDHSQWGIKLYIANLGRTPFLIKRRAELYVTNQDGAKYIHPCFLVVFEKDEDGDESKYTADSPLVVPSESDIYLEFVTSNAQYEMGNGRVFREIFASGSARCWIKFDIERIGVFRNQKIITPKAIFAES